MSEDDAIGKRCCGPTGCGQVPKDPVYYAGPYNAERWCIGSQCMAWRWLSVDDETGYCGLAGAE